MSAWSDSEVEAIVADYFAMFRSELRKQPYNKAQHRRALMDRLNGRSAGSVEMKHANISAVLIDMRLPYIDGYKPRANYQRRLLPEAVKSYLDAHPDLLELVQWDVMTVDVQVPTVNDLLTAMEAPPEPKPETARGVGEAPAMYLPAGLDYLEVEARNQALGKAGEAFVMNYERARLIHAGKVALADRIEQVSATIGPSAGYDVRSYDASGRDRLIEVKTTRYGKYTPFYVTSNELRTSRSQRDAYHLYRVFRFRDRPGLFALPGGIDDTCQLDPSLYVARAGLPSVQHRAGSNP